MTARARIALWIAAGMLVALLLWLALGPRPGERLDGSGGGDRSVTDDVWLSGLPGPLAGYLGDCALGAETPDAADGFNRHAADCAGSLADAIAVILEADTTRAQLLEWQFGTYDREVDVFQESGWAAAGTGGELRDVLMPGALLLVSIQRSRFGDVPEMSGEVAELRRSVREIDRQRTAFDQRASVVDFFDTAGEVLILMAEHISARGEELE
jgi:hypothetical protein